MRNSLKAPPGREDDPEEGEILSDDLEDISDESLILTPQTHNGKSLSRSDHLRALSLSSVSDLDELPKPKCRKRKRTTSRKYLRKRRIQRRRRSQKKIVVGADSSDDEVPVNKKLKLQLKAAVRVDVTEAHRNSLRTRLRAMVKGDNDSDTSDVVLKTETDGLSNQALENNPPDAIIDLVDQDTSSCVEILGSGSENGANESATEVIDNAAEELKGEEVDSELIQLRLEALKTAIDKKYAKRKRKKEIAEGAYTDDTNKENTSNNSDEIQGKIDSPTENKVEAPQTNNVPDSNIPPPPDEDEDVLRALLLASIANKITKTRPELTNQIESKTTLINPNKKKINNTIKKKLNINNAKWVVNKTAEAPTLIRMPQVKPLIINLNSDDSDSDWDLSSSPEKSPKKNPKSSSSETIENSHKNDIESAVIESNVEKFLKEQRAKVESKLVTTADINTVAKTAAKTITTAVTKLKHNHVSNHAQKLPELERSTLKFLPANKREEYKKLQHLLQVKRAQLKRTRAKRISTKTNENGNILKTALANKNETDSGNHQKEVCSVIPTHSIMLSSAKSTSSPATIANKKPNNVNMFVRKVVHHRFTQTDDAQLPPKSEAQLQELRRQESRAVTRNQERKTAGLLIRSTLKELQTKKDGRLQIQEEYRSVRPLLKNINEISKQQKHWDQEVARLMKQLLGARKKQEELHTNMMKSVKELSEKKKIIDLSLSVEAAKPKPNNLVTSTPIKPASTGSQISFSSTISSDTISDSQNMSEIMLDTWEQSTIVNNNPRAVQEAAMGVMDPNDIDNVIKKTEERVALLEKKESFECRRSQKVRYVSPLDVTGRRNSLDPLEIVCPFDMNGSCRDPDCSYNHLPK